MESGEGQPVQPDTVEQQTPNTQKGGDKTPKNATALQPPITEQLLNTNPEENNSGAQEPPQETTQPQLVPTETTQPETEHQSPQEELTQELTKIGFSPEEIEKAVALLEHSGSTTHLAAIEGLREIFGDEEGQEKLQQYYKPVMRKLQEIAEGGWEAYAKALQECKEPKLQTLGRQIEMAALLEQIKKLQSLAESETNEKEKRNMQSLIESKQRKLLPLLEEENNKESPFKELQDFYFIFTGERPDANNFRLDQITEAIGNLITSPPEGEANTALKSFQERLKSIEGISEEKIEKIIQTIENIKHKYGQEIAKLVKKQEAKERVKGGVKLAGVGGLILLFILIKMFLTEEK